MSGKNEVYDQSADKWRAVTKADVYRAWRYAVCTSDTLVYSGPCIYGGVKVNVALSAHALPIRDAIAAGAGNIIDSLAASSAIGTQREGPIICNTGLFVDFDASGTGTIVVLYQPL